MAVPDAEDALMALIEGANATAPTPTAVLHNTVTEVSSELARDLKALPANYNFEVPKTIQRIREAGAKTVALQFPEGLLMYSCVIADILERHAAVETIIMGDVTYGACCVDDYTARALGATFLVHYGHSCLVPISVSQMQMLYVFVSIGIDVDHLVATVALNFAPVTRIALIATVQFLPSMQAAKVALETAHGFTGLSVPQARPLSGGEVLGCTSPTIKGADALVYVADGRFHLESAMIANPSLPAFQYDPFTKRITRERYEHQEMLGLRSTAVERARGARRIGVILGTLGRQGSPGILSYLESELLARGIPHFVLLLSEVYPAKLARMPDVDAWVQVACPRLSIDWGHSFAAPLLNPYEAAILLGAAAWGPTYPMDFYSRGGGPWTNYFDPAAAAAAAVPGSGDPGDVGDSAPGDSESERAARRAKRKAAVAARKRQLAGDAQVEK
eukprot:a175023_54.p1 GENE.a175023_54~~a175023_54.p1  ORF type:complete len:456 (+),score=107.71 a175023_54:28-1368(+)